VDRGGRSPRRTGLRFYRLRYPNKQRPSSRLSVAAQSSERRYQPLAQGNTAECLRREDGGSGLRRRLPKFPTRARPRQTERSLRPRPRPERRPPRR
jgi:hypothetical protein